MSSDLALFNYLNALAGQWAFVDSLIIFCAHYLPYIVVLALLIQPFLKGSRHIHWTAVIVAFTGALIARLGVKSAIVFFHPRTRPFEILPNAHQLLAINPNDINQSFPSGHAIFFFALAAGFYAYNRILGILLFLLAAVISIARVVAGVHWPSDILGGALLGTIIGFLTVYLYRHFAPRFTKTVREALHLLN